MQDLEFHLKNFCLIMAAFAIGFLWNYKMVEWANTRTVFGFHCDSDVRYAIAVTFASFCFFGWVSGVLFNFVYIKEALRFGNNMWFVQFFILCASPISFFLMNRIVDRANSPIDMRTAISLFLIFLAAVVRYWR